MEQGNEGDEILFLSCRSIGCDLPASIQRVGELTVEQLIDIIAKALFLISNGDIQISSNLPSNIAVRHRICTDISIKIKDLGFHGECGYNQLLYPVEHQTRELLKWIVEKVPRSHDEGVEEILGANAILNRNIMQSIQNWQKSLWHLPACLHGKPPTNKYKKISFQHRSGLAASLLNRHATAKIEDTQLTEKMNRKFMQKDQNQGAGGEDQVNNENAALLQQKIVTSMKEVDNRTTPSNHLTKGNYADGSSVDGKESFSAAEAKSTAQLNLSFQELIQSITSSAKEKDGQRSSEEETRGGRFAHATVFSQENGDPMLTASGTITMGPSLVALGVRENFSAFVDPAKAAADAAYAAKLASIAKGGIEAAQKFAKMDLQERKAQMEKEEQERQEELQVVRNDIQDLTTSVEAGKALDEKILKAIGIMEDELSRLQKETDELEKECIVRRKALEMMPSAAENIAKLQAICDKGTERLQTLEQEWEKVREPLEQELLQQERKKAARMNKFAVMIEEIKQYREVMVGMVHDLKEKQDRAMMLEEEKTKLPKNLNRALYTHRIMDITSSIAKQNKEITKITSDIRDLQKTINLNTNTLNRADAITEELIFKAASDKNDPVMVDTYRRLKQLRSNFEALINTVSSIGQTEKAIRDLETKIDQEQSRISSNNYERIQNDLQAIMQENTALMTQIKKLTGK